MLKKTIPQEAKQDGNFKTSIRFLPTV